MDNNEHALYDAQRKVTKLVYMARWIWVVNSIAGIISITRTRYDIAILAAFTWILSLLAAAFGHRAVEYLRIVERNTL